MQNRYILGEKKPYMNIFRRKYITFTLLDIRWKMFNRHAQFKITVSFSWVHLCTPLRLRKHSFSPISYDDFFFFFLFACTIPSVYEIPSRNILITCISRGISKSFTNFLTLEATEHCKVELSWSGQNENLIDFWKIRWLIFGKQKYRLQYFFTVHEYSSLVLFRCRHIFIHNSHPYICSSCFSKISMNGVSWNIWCCVVLSWKTWCVILMSAWH